MSKIIIRDLKTIVWDFRVSKLNRVHAFGDFLYEIGVYSIDSSKPMGVFPWSPEPQPVISQTQPIHLYQMAGSPHSVGEKRENPQKKNPQSHWIFLTCEHTVVSLKSLVQNIHFIATAWVASYKYPKADSRAVFVTIYVWLAPWQIFFMVR